MNGADVKDVVAELRKQGWDLTLTSDGASWRATPPDRTRRIVVFSGRPKDMVGILRELRHQGFVWPPVHTNGHATVDPRPSATPFPPKPNPESTTEPRTKEAPAASTGTDDLALAFLKLREAKEYERVAAADMMKCEKELKAAKDRMSEASAAYQDALEEMAAAKSVFDRLFDPSKAVAG